MQKWFIISKSTDIIHYINVGGRGIKILPFRCQKRFAHYRATLKKQKQKQEPQKYPSLIQQEYFFRNQHKLMVPYQRHIQS